MGQEQIQKDLEEMKGLVAGIASTLEDFEGSEGDRKQVMAKMTQDLEDHIKSSEDYRETTTASIEELKKEKETGGKTLYDLVVKEPEIKDVCDVWGFSNPLERQLYAPKTKWSPKRGWEKTGSYDLPEEVMAMNDFLYIFGCQKAMLAGSPPNENPEIVRQKIMGLHTYKMFRWELEGNTELRKALNTSDGSNWVPTGMSATLIDDVRLARKVSGLFGRITIPLGVGSFDNPIRGAAQRAYLAGEATGDSPTDYPAGTVPTDKVTFTAVKHALLMRVSDEMREDAAIAVMPLVREELVQAIVDAEEDSTLNGDTSTTHQDSNVTASNDVRKSFAGLRYNAGGSSGQAAVDISTLSFANLRSMRKKMGRFGVNPTQMAAITGASGYIQLLGDATNLNILTIDKAGDRATWFTGQLAEMDGFPIVVSEFIAQDLNTTGVYDGTTTTDTVILFVNRPAFKYADKPGGMLIEQDRDIKVGQDYVVASRRLDFKQAITPGSDEETVALGYSLTS